MFFFTLNGCFLSGWVSRLGFGLLRRAPAVAFLSLFPSLAPASGKRGPLPAPASAAGLCRSRLAKLVPAFSAFTSSVVLMSRPDPVPMMSRPDTLLLLTRPLPFFN